MTMNKLKQILQKATTWEEYRAMVREEMRK